MNSMKQYRQYCVILFWKSFINDHISFKEKAQTRFFTKLWRPLSLEGFPCGGNHCLGGNQCFLLKLCIL